MLPPRRVTVKNPQVGGRPEFTNRLGDIETPPASTACLPASRRAVENLIPPCLSAASRRPGPSTRPTIVRDANGQALAYVYFEDASAYGRGSMRKALLFVIVVAMVATGLWLFVAGLFFESETNIWYVVSGGWLIGLGGDRLWRDFVAPFLGFEEG